MDEERDVLGEETPMEDSETVSDGGDDLFDGESWSDGEVEESTPPVEEVVTAAAAVEEKAERDFTGEALALLQAYPRLRGQRLPDEVLVECARGTQLLAAYREGLLTAEEIRRSDEKKAAVQKPANDGMDKYLNW